MVERAHATEIERLQKLAAFPAILADAGIDPRELVQRDLDGKVERKGGKRAPRSPSIGIWKMV